MRFPSINEIELQWKGSVSQFCIVIEGETEQDDTWFYNQWFGDRAREVEFFPQNGWEKVTNAVVQLRGLLGERVVYGIVDRDFRENQSYDTVPTDGILQTPRYTLENYLLDPECWYKVVRPFTRRESKPGWNSAEEVRETVDGFYRQCAPLAAYNYTLQIARELNEIAFEALSEPRRKSHSHPSAITNRGDIPQLFRSLQEEMGITENLEGIYQTNLDLFNQLELAELNEFVSGKHVMAVLHESFPIGYRDKKQWSDRLGAYIDACPEPPDDLRMLIDLIVGSDHSPQP